MCITSPPYYNLRDYEEDGQLGLEKTPDLYIDHLCDIFDNVKQVLRDDGSCWINIGDSYDNKSLVGIPFKLAEKMKNRGWILRNTIIWHKPSAMPSSVTDRFTVDFEYIFFFTKQKKYYYEQQFTPNKNDPKDINRQYVQGKTNTEYATSKKHSGGVGYDERGRNKRTTWSINPKPFNAAHFAVYPRKLIRTPIKAGCPKEVCSKCGNPKHHVVVKEKKENRVNTREDSNVRPDNLERPPSDWKPRKIIEDYWEPTCECDKNFTGGIVLDPFMGAGTTALEALGQNKRFIGIELNQKYIDMSYERLVDHGYYQFNELLPKDKQKKEKGLF
jgi:site-specific DNA-methyltransferase (adenine-specific)